MDYNVAKQRHLGNISRQVGHDVGNKYSYIVSQDDLINNYLQMRNELGYPLMIDSKKRRAIVYNKIGLEKKIQQIIDNCIINNIKLLDKIIVEDITSQLNGLTQNASGAFVMGKGSVKNSMINLLSNAMVKGIVDGVGKVIEDMNG